MTIKNFPNDRHFNATVPPASHYTTMLLESLVSCSSQISLMLCNTLSSFVSNPQFTDYTNHGFLCTL